MSCNHISRKALMLSIVIAICLAGTAMAATLYVDASVAATGDGSLASPFKTIGEAITASVAGDEIRIAGGTYDNEPTDMAIKGQQVISGSYNSIFTISDRSKTPTIIDMADLTEQEQDRTFRCRGTASFIVKNLVIQNSTSGEFDDTDNGGAMYIQSGSSGTIRGVSFIKCATRFEGGVESGPAREGGAVCIRDASTVAFEDCVFDSCTAVGGGGAVRMRNAGTGNNVEFHRCLFTHCGARNNGSVIDDGDGVSQVEIVNCIFANNGVDVDIPSGTAHSHYLIRVSDRRTLIYNCTFVGNNNPDGFMFSIGNSGDAAGAKEIVNCIIANNTIVSGGSTFAIFSYGADYADATTLQNNLFFSNSGLDPLDPTGAGIIGVNGNIAGDPQFADAANGDYHLNAGSPGEDAGQTLALVPDDFTGAVRPVGPAYDIGAIEGQAPPEPLSSTVQSVVATASSSRNADSGPGKTVDGSGLNASDQHDTRIANMWASAAGQQPPVWIQYEFDKVYKLDQMWVWNSNNDLELLVGLGVKTATIEYSTDGATWTALANVPEFAQAPGTADYTHDTTVDFGGAAARFVRMTCTSSWGGGGQYSLSEVRFFYIPVWARDPKPATGATGVPIDTTLSWKAGRQAASHEIHLGTDMQAVTDSTAPVATVSQAAYAPANLQLDMTYYWKVVEVNQAESPIAWDSEVWSFSMSQYLLVDDFESYTDASPNRVFQTWIDGAGFSPDEFFPNGNNGNGTGSLVGYDPAAGPIMERKIMHGGRQSMPLSYDGLSEITRTFEPAQDWTRGGIKTLVLFFQGESTNVSGGLYVKINGVKVPYSGNADDLMLPEWTQSSIDLPSSAGLAAVTTLTIGVSAGQGTLYIDDIRLYPVAPATNP
jgi:hypothetical protein